jgi:hypothetical protein
MGVMMGSRGVLAVLLSGVVSLVEIDAFAQENIRSPDVSNLIERGRELRRNREPREALKIFAEAHALRPSSATFTQMALTEQMLQRWVSAEEHFRAALAFPKSDPWLNELPQPKKTNREFAETALKSVQSHIGDLEVKGAAGTEISLPSEENPQEIVSRGRLPLNKPLRVGEGQIELRADPPGQERTVLTVDIVGGARVVVAVAGKAANLVSSNAITAKSVGSHSSLVTPPNARNDAARFDALNEPFWSTGRKWAVGTGAVILAAGVGLLAINGHAACGTEPCEGRLQTVPWGIGAALLGAGIAGAGLFVSPTRAGTSVAAAGVSFAGRW